MNAEYMDDFVVDDCGWSLLVAVVAMRLGRIFYGGRLCLFNRSHWGRLSYFISSYGAGIIWNLGVILACIQ